MNPLDLANQAYDKDFRWWFLVLLFGVFVAGIWIFRYLVGRMDKAEKAHADQVRMFVEELKTSRQHHHDRLEAMVAQYFTQAQELSKIIAANTAESREVRRFLEEQSRK